MLTVANPQIAGPSLISVPKGVRMEPVLQIISGILDPRPELVEMVASDLTRCLKNPMTGRKGLTPTQVLRSLIVMRIKNLDLRELRERINDGMTLRHFTGFNDQKVPKHRAFNTAFNRLTSKTMDAVNGAIVQMAIDLGLEDGNKLRADTTVVETDIHYPTDASLMWDTVRVVTRLVGELVERVDVPVKGFRDRTRSARRRMQEIQRMTAKQRNKNQKRKYRQLIDTTSEVVQGARAVVEQTQSAFGKDLSSGLALDAIRIEIKQFCALGERVIDQARRRVLQDEQVPTNEKVYSIFEPHTDLIIRGKARTPVEFGHKIFLAESASGLITQYKVLDGNPKDEHHVKPSLQRHRQTFDHSPELYSLDRGFFNEGNVKACVQDGVKTPCIPQCGGKKTPEREAYEKSPEFKKGQRFRAGIEGTISVLFRGRGMKRCRTQGRERFEVFVASAVLANNLMRIAELLIKRTSGKRRACSKRKSVH